MTRLFYFIIIYGLVSGFLWGVTVAMTGSFKLTLNHVLLVQTAAFPLYFITLYTLNKTSSFLGDIMTGRLSKTVPLRATLAADLSRVKVKKMNGDYQDALEIIDRLLSRDPHFPEALFVKSQILIDGFKDITGAKRCLKKLMKKVSSAENIYQWASSYLEEIENRKPEKTLPPVVRSGRDERKAFSTELYFADKKRSYRGYIRNISYGGLFIETRNHIPSGESITMTFPAQDSCRNLKLQGQVAWSNSDGIGVIFKLDNQDQRIMLQSLLESI